MSEAKRMATQVGSRSRYLSYYCWKIPISCKPYYLLISLWFQVEKCHHYNHSQSRSHSDVCSAIPTRPPPPNWQISFGGSLLVTQEGLNWYFDIQSRVWRFSIYFQMHVEITSNWYWIQETAVKYQEIDTNIQYKVARIPFRCYRVSANPLPNWICDVFVWNR